MLKEELKHAVKKGCRIAGVHAPIAKGPSRTCKPQTALSLYVTRPVPAVSQQPARWLHLGITNAWLRGSAFLKQWMEFLEEHADLRYPNLADVYEKQ